VPCHHVLPALVAPVDDVVVIDVLVARLVLGDKGATLATDASMAASVASALARGADDSGVCGGRCGRV
jgi:hypothetical protein